MQWANLSENVYVELNINLPEKKKKYIFPTISLPMYHLNLVGNFKITCV